MEKFMPDVMCAEGVQGMQPVILKFWALPRHRKFETRHRDSGVMADRAYDATEEVSSSQSRQMHEATMKIGKEEGIQGYWRGYFPQVIRVVPYSAVQLVAYEAYKKVFKGQDEGLSISGRLAAGACAGMTSTLITYPLDVLRLRLAVDPASKSMLQVASTMLREEGLASFYKGLGPSLLGIAPYVALNFCAFDLIKKALPEDVQKTPTASFVTAFLSASLATSMCYPLDTARRQLQMKDTPFLTIGDALPGIFLSLFSLILCSTFYFPVPLPVSR
ncbi:hypothetical protein L7F22_060493 [Adiantum nelumboides]|nr:hypothetical protein [Adiantum nelumboides]